MSNLSSAIIGGVVGAVLPALGATWYLSELNTRFETHLEHPIGEQRGVLPSGVVVASLKRCSDLEGDWENYEPGAGRVIVGVGTEEIDGTSRTFRFEEEDGYYAHILQPEEMPGHSHALDVTSVGDVPGGGNLAVRGELDGQRDFQTYPAGGSDTHDTAEAHNNMPPYIALYLCEKT